MGDMSGVRGCYALFYYDLFFLGEIAYLQALPQRVTSRYAVKNFNKISLEKQAELCKL